MLRSVIVSFCLSGFLSFLCFFRNKEVIFVSLSLFMFLFHLPRYLVDLDEIWYCCLYWKLSTELNFVSCLVALMDMARKD
jgi:hypothetical protein